MIVLSNSAAQTLAPGASVTFDNVVRKAGNGECFRQGGSSVRVRGTQCGASYDVSFGANIGATAPGVAVLAIQFDGSTLPETVAQSTTAAAGDLNNVARTTNVSTCGFGDSGSISLTNVGTTEITVGAGAVLEVSRRS